MQRTRTRRPRKLLPGAPRRTRGTSPPFPQRTPRQHTQMPKLPRIILRALHLGNHLPADLAASHAPLIRSTGPVSLSGRHGRHAAVGWIGHVGHVLVVVGWCLIGGVGGDVGIGLWWGVVVFALEEEDECADEQEEEGGATD